MSKKRVLKEPNRKKLKLYIESTPKKALEDLQKTNINDEEIERFLKIFSIITDQEENALAESEAIDSEDGIIDIILIIETKIRGLLEGDNDSLNLPKILSKSLKTLKELVSLFKLKDAKNKNDNAEGKKAT